MRICRASGTPAEDPAEPIIIPAYGGEKDRSIDTRAGEENLPPSFAIVRRLRDFGEDLQDLLMNDANIFITGKDVGEWKGAVDGIAKWIRYNTFNWTYSSTEEALNDADRRGRIYLVPGEVSGNKWPWAAMLQGLTVWIDTEGHPPYTMKDMERDHMIWKEEIAEIERKRFGPPPKPNVHKKQHSYPITSPIQLWRECDVHADVTKLKSEEESGVPTEKEKTVFLMKAMRQAMIDKPPKWRVWMEQAKASGRVPMDYLTPYEVAKKARGPDWNR